MRFLKDQRTSITVFAVGLLIPAYFLMGTDTPQGTPAISSEKANAEKAERVRLREREAEPLYQEAVSAANDPATQADGVLSAIKKALEAGSCPTRVLTEGAFARFHTQPQFRELIRDHARQSSINMRLAGDPGEPLHVSGVVLGSGDVPVAGALVYVYHTDAKGLYSTGGLDEANPRLFGYMRSDALGRFAFKTIRPGHYPDQDEPVEQHIHGEVTAEGYKTRIVRIGFADDPFWSAQGRQPPRWAGPVTRETDGVASCRIEVRLERP